MKTNNLKLMNMETKEFYHEKDNCRHSVWRCVGFGVMGIIGFIAFLIIGGAIIMLLWNWLMPSLFHFSNITFWQSVGLALLARLLFGAAHHRWHHMGRRKMWHAYSGCCGDHPHSYRNFHNMKDENCKSYFHAWKYYDKFWEEEGENAFKDYIKRKSEDPEKGQEKTE